MADRFTDCAESALDRAEELARELGHTYIGTEHLLLGIIDTPECKASKLLLSHGIRFEETKALIISLDGVGEASYVDAADMSPRLKRVILHSAYSVCEKAITAERLLASLINEPRSTAVKLIRSQGASLAEIYGELLGISKDEKEPQMTFDGAQAETQKKLPEAIAKYGSELTEKARRGLLDPVIGRDTETECLIGILLRRTKNNPCLIGEPGVGKTAVIEGLAERIASGNVPPALIGKRIISLDLPLMLAGAKYRGEFEERMKSVMAEAEKDSSFIFFIDEIHTAVGAGGSEGAVDVANMIKPALARGEMRVIGATTPEEYRRHIEKDAAFERRFQPLIIKEPSPASTEMMLRGLRKKYEQHHLMTISDGAISAAVRLSERYVPERFFPDKAIDILDEAASKKRLYASYGLEEAEPTLLPSDVADTLSRRIGIPISENGSELEGINDLEARLGKAVFGQESALSNVTAALKRGFLDISDGGHPLASFAFIGGGGVGKNELAKAISKELFGGESEPIKLDMSEYTEHQSISRLIGSPPGYIGYRDEGILSRKLKLRPRSVVIFDSLERAHPDVISLLCRIPSEGFISDSLGKRIDFRNSIVIFILRNKISELKQGIGFSCEGGIISDTDTGCSQLISKLDAVIRFSHLSPDTAEKIAKRELERLSNKLSQIGVSLEFSDDMPSFIERHSSYFSDGGNAIKKFIGSSVTEGLGELLAANCEKDKKLLVSPAKNGKIELISVTNGHPSAYHMSK